MRATSPIGARRSLSTWPGFAIAALLCSICLPGASAGAAPRPDPASAPEAPQMVGEATLESGNGAALLRWALARDEEGEGEGDVYEYELQESGSPEFSAPTLRYRGTMPSWYVSGRLDGRSWFRVRGRPWAEGQDQKHGQNQWSEWSEAQVLVVAHHDLRLALALFGLGALVFVATAGTVLVSSRTAGGTDGGGAGGSEGEGC
ncbi:hypothetical protein G6O69_24570 [Pseudenhygromyxa sp. WMMC2535]|uniref:hypothetical protein n=1 Tax=Pseudenhygromyxa sp. WMMC2535 TaxID=2712867 RepID=UPI00159541A5|nr:hypothetical protein [Pseudenhygromyxa sp. WMMC2535]NVB41038.1 hypothetical protein [Pseudenhygromyxa sp. WMMC2535]